MVEQENSLNIVVVPRDQIPSGVTISKVPTTPAEAVAFELVPLPEEEDYCPSSVHEVWPPT